MQCERCRSSLVEGESYNFHGQSLCEDCYIYLLNPPRACDPAAVVVVEPYHEAILLADKAKTLAAEAKKDMRRGGQQW